MKRAFAVAGALCALCTAATGWAGNEDPFPMGDLAALSAGAVVAAGNDCGAAAYNPAGLVAMRRNAIAVNASVLSLRRFRIPGYLQAETPQGTERMSAVDLSIASVPSAVIIAGKPRADLAWALSLTVPVLDDLRAYRRSGAPGSGGFTYRESLRIVNTAALYRAGVSAAWAPRDGLRMGITLNGVIWQTSSTTGLELSYVEESGRHTYLDTDRVVTGKALALDAVAGVQWSPSPRYTLGISLEPPIVGLFGSLRDEQSVFLTRTPPGQPPVVIDSLVMPTNGMRGQHVAGLVARAGIAIVNRRGWLSGQIDHIAGRSGDVLSKTRPVTNLRVGGIHDVSASLRVGGGAFTDFDSADPAGRDLRFDFVGLSAGLTWSRALPLRDRPEPLLLKTTFAARYSHGWGRTTILSSNPTSEDLTMLVETSDVAGTVNELSLYIGTGVDF